jgi:hypothetical protein
MSVLEPSLQKCSQKLEVILYFLILISVILKTFFIFATDFGSTIPEVQTGTELLSSKKHITHVYGISHFAAKIAVFVSYC